MAAPKSRTPSAAPWHDAENCAASVSNVQNWHHACSSSQSLGSFPTIVFYCDPSNCKSGFGCNGPSTCKGKRIRDGGASQPTCLLPWPKAWGMSPGVRVRPCFHTHLCNSLRAYALITNTKQNLLVPVHVIYLRTEFGLTQPLLHITNS